MNARSQTLLWLAQRVSAMVLVLCVLAHLIIIIYAVRGGLSAAEIFGRTRGNATGFAFYALFVLAVSVHAPIGLRAIALEWLGWKGRSLEWAVLLAGLALLVLGWRAAWAVFA